MKSDSPWEHPSENLWLKEAHGGDLLYIYKENEKFGYGIRIEGVGLVCVTMPIFKLWRTAEIQGRTTFNAHCTDMQKIIALINSNNPHLTDPGGYPTFAQACPLATGGDTEEPLEWTDYTLRDEG